MDPNLEDQYEFAMGSGYSSLERTGEHEFRVDPNLSYEDNPYGDIYTDAVYGGRVNPEGNQNFYVYEVEWPEGTERPEREELEALGEELNQVFGGWIISASGDRVFALRDEIAGEKAEQRRREESGNEPVD